MISCQVQVRFDESGIVGLYSNKSKSNCSSRIWATATVVKLDSEFLHFYFVKESIGEHLMKNFFLGNSFLMKDDFCFSEQPQIDLRLPDCSVIPAGQYACKDMGSRIAVQFNYTQTKELINVKPHLKAA